MEGTEGQVEIADVRTSSVDSQRALTEFRESIADHVAAIQRSGREFLASPGTSENAARQEIQIEIGVGPGREDESALYDSVDCWDEDVICGKSTTGYIHCTVHVCMKVGPVTLAPG